MEQILFYINCIILFYFFLKKDDTSGLYVLQHCFCINFKKYISVLIVMSKICAALLLVLS